MSKGRGKEMSEMALHSAEEEPSEAFYIEDYEAIPYMDAIECPSDPPGVKDAYSGGGESSDGGLGKGQGKKARLPRRA